MSKRLKAWIRPRLFALVMLSWLKGCKLTELGEAQGMVNEKIPPESQTTYISISFGYKESGW